MERGVPVFVVDEFRDGQRAAEACTRVEIDPFFRNERHPALLEEWL